MVGGGLGYVIGRATTDDARPAAADKGVPGPGRWVWPENGWPGFRVPGSWRGSQGDDRSGWPPGWPPGWSKGEGSDRGDTDRGDSDKDSDQSTPKPSRTMAKR